LPSKFEEGLEQQAREAQPECHGDDDQTRSIRGQRVKSFSRSSSIHLNGSAGGRTFPQECTTRRTFFKSIAVEIAFTTLLVAAADPKFI
jgi:hypothetical protein